MNYSSEERHYIIDWVLILAGALCGLCIAWMLDGFQCHFPGEIEKARALGIVSATILEGYPKSRDLFTYFFVLILPAMGALAFWLPRRKSSVIGANTLLGGFSFPTRSFGLSVIFITLAVGLLTWNFSAMLSSKWNPYVGSWILLGEQGATMAWVHSIMNGGVYGRDFFSLYGPMFIYPLTWLMSFLGQTVFTEQIYRWLLDMASFAVLGFILLRTLRAKWLAIFFIIIIFIYTSAFTATANRTILRTVLGLFPIVCMVLWMDTKRTGWLIAGGLLLGQSLLFSQEAGICAAVTIFAMIAAYSISREENTFAKLRVMMFIFVSLLISLTPMLGFLLLNGAMPGFLDSLVGYPKTVLMGYGAVPFPAIRDWLFRNFRDVWIYYAVISVYVASAIALCIAWFRGVRSARIFWAWGLLIYGVLLFRVALGRSSVDQTIKIMIPAILLSALWIDEMWTDWRRNTAPNGRRRFAPLVIIAAVAANLFIGIGCDPIVRMYAAFSCHNVLSLEGRFKAAYINGVNVAEIPRLREFVDPNTAVNLTAVNNFLNTNTQKGEYVYFFPNEAVCYFLFNRANPTRYAMAYFASSYERQKEIINDLERNKPRYIVYSKKTWRIDYIPENIQIPLIVDYINQNYATVTSLNDIDILMRGSAGKL